MKTTSKLIALLAITLALFSSCHSGIIIEGNGIFVEETRTIPAFEQIYVDGSFNVFFTHADSSSVRIKCESNILPYIETAVFNKKLDIKFASHISIMLNEDIDIYITGPYAEKIDLAGSGNITCDSLAAEKGEIIISGSGNIFTNFYGKEFESEISGSGTMDIFGDCDIINTTISGSGSIALEAPDCDFASVTISGSGSAKLIGSADEVKFINEGSGKIKAYDFPVKKAEIDIEGSGYIYVNVSESLVARIDGSGNIYYIGNPAINFKEFGSGSLINDN